MQITPNEKRIVAVIPCYNEQATIRRVVLGAFNSVTDVIVINDGSKDKSEEEAKKAGPGVVVKSAVYDIQQKTSEISLEAFVNKEIILELDNMPPGDYLAKLQSGAGEAAVNLSVTGNGQLRLPLKLSQDTPVQVRIFPK